jgi:carbon monoxide dehydrogenase subunit G
MSSKKVEKMVEASPAAVFAFVTDLKNATKHIPGVKKLELLSKGELGVGSRFLQERTILGTTLEQEMEITEFDPPTTYAARGEAHGCEVTGRLSLESEETGTRVRAELTVEPQGFAGKLAASMILKGAEIAMHEDLEAMKSALESR